MVFKLIPETPKQHDFNNYDCSRTVATKSSKRITAKSQNAWLKKNSKPKKKAISEYEHFEDLIVKNKSDRMDIIDHSFDIMVSQFV